LISATLGTNIKSLAADLMTQFKTVGFSKDNEDTIVIPEGLTQYYSMVFDEFKLIHLIAFLFCHRDKKIIIFVSSCETVNFLLSVIKNFEFLIENVKFFENVELLKLHGKMKHDERKVIFKSFLSSKNAFLISTDVASRGLDFPLVDIIVHFDVNPDRKDYVNRMGRTARLDHKGHSVLFLMQNEHKLLQTCLGEFNVQHLESRKILSTFANKFNKELFKGHKQSKSEMEYLELSKQAQMNPDKYLDSDYYYEQSRSVIDPIRKSLKNFIFKDRENLILARSAFNTSVKAYTTFMKYQKDVFNAKALNLTKFVSIC
jgi:superfamily II DNA/RNA helicase